MCITLFTVTLGWKVKAQSKNRPLAGTEMTAQSWLPLPSGQSRKQNHHMPFICWKNYEVWTCSTVNKWSHIPLYVVCKGIILHIWLMPCLVTWLRQLTWFIARFPTLLKNNLWLSDNGPIIPFMQKRSMYKRGCELQIQSQAVFSLLWSNNVIHHFSSNSSTPQAQKRIPQRISIKLFAYPHM